ncbi:MAG: hypothetical protein O2904_04695 [bacterium]|nr:hypothetical protein [bacterium]
MTSTPEHRFPEHVFALDHPLRTIEALQSTTAIEQLLALAEELQEDTLVQKKLIANLDLLRAALALQCDSITKAFLLKQHLSAQKDNQIADLRHQLLLMTEAFQMAEWELSGVKKKLDE